MARGKQLPNIGEDYTPIADPPSELAVRVADMTLAPLLNDPDPEAYFERIKRADPKAYWVMLKDAIAVKSQALRAAPHVRTPLAPVSPIGPKPKVIDVAE